MLVTKSNPAGGGMGGDTREGTSRGWATEWRDRAGHKGKKERNEVEKEYKRGKEAREIRIRNRKTETGERQRRRQKGGSVEREDKREEHRVRVALGRERSLPK